MFRSEIGILKRKVHGMKQLRWPLLASVIMISGCITATVLTVGYLVYAQIEAAGNTVGMNYHAGFDKTWAAALAQVAEMGEADAAKKAKRKKDSGEVELPKTTLEVATIKGNRGTRVQAVIDPSDADQVKRAREFLLAVAGRLNEHQELVRSYPADLKTTWDAALAQLEHMGYKPEEGAVLKGGSGTIRLKIEDDGRTKEAWILVEQVTPGSTTRVKVGLGAYDAEPGMPKAHEFLDQVAQRIAK
jgi:hypothetical protein